MVLNRVEVLGITDVSEKVAAWLFMIEPFRTWTRGKRFLRNVGYSVHLYVVLQSNVSTVTGPKHQSCGNSDWYIFSWRTVFHVADLFDLFVHFAPPVDSLQFMIYMDHS
jgi:hypothetical protein